MGGVRKTERTLPGGSAIRGATEQPGGATGGRAPGLVMESVSGTVGPIYRKPFLIAATCEPVGLQLCPGLAAIGRAVDVVTK